MKGERGVSMKFIQSRRSPAAAGDGTVDRRGVIVGASVAGVAAMATQILRGGAGAVEAPVALAAKPLPAKEAGYRATPHVLRYYETAKS
jgi:hypothetical protein